ncbi:5'-methylthioadenosine phosphorylase [Actinopolyspora biskrensis]|uniref:Purine nucleoside phosphorylase n=1 Tax=Actinopolyspora biskrensis TaxID=1470178 RepID=A0A852YUV2_9ACTN|nr:S-methyl-5'-thioadenosine phosphorylase [Actinopolyspora biskrensis]NYH77512.1 5'-methylthioadenosine phosphorylase [Actinopolyspora biskrensis]
MSTTPIAIIGGTGFYRFLDEGEDHHIDTPYGSPSAPIRIGEVAGQRVAFLPRHGRNHDFLPSEVPFKANLWALREAGVRQVIAFNSVGSLQSEYRKGEFVLVDQFVDRTHGRDASYFTGSDIAHVSAAEPYCERMRNLAEEALQDADIRIHRTGTVVVIQGPRFSTTAESRWFSQQGWHLVNMTQYPEVILARELEMCYANLSYITDYDVAAKEVVGDAEEAVSHAAVIKAFSSDSELIYGAIQRLVKALPDEDCQCRSALANARG